MVENPTPPFQNHKNESEKNNMNADTDEEIENDMQELDLDADYESDFLESEEFQAIDNELNKLNSVLDTLEQKNDDILAELTKLLKENREIRQQLQVFQENTESNEAK